MIVTDSTLLQSIIEANKPLSVRTAERLARYVCTEFDPKSDACWAVADKLWRAALMTRDVDRGRPQ